MAEVIDVAEANDAWAETEPGNPQAKWDDVAACLPYDTYLWYADSGDNAATEKAKEVCKGCPVLVPCLIESLKRGEKFGIWGGAGNPSRRWLRKAWNQRRHDSCWIYNDPTCCPLCEALDQHRRRLAGEDVGPVQTNGPDAEHGKYITYNRGCRCVPCRQAKADYMSA